LGGGLQKNKENILLNQSNKAGNGKTMEKSYRNT
jgi:hypothetical protein